MSTEPAQRTHVLVVEDEREVADGIADCLLREGITSSTAPNGEKAFEWLRSTSRLPDAIVLDLWMPVMNGWKFRAEQRRDPELSRIPVVVISADVGPQAEAIDAAAFLRKPVDAPQLVSALRRVIAEARDRAWGERELQTERLAALGRLAGGIAHEVNNPLGWILSNLRALRDGLPDVMMKAREVGGADSAELEELVDDLQLAIRDSLEGAERIREIVHQVRTYDNPRAATTSFVDLSALLDESLRLAALHAQKTIKFERELKPTPPVLGDRGRFNQLFLNVLLNAVDAVSACPDGGCVTVRAGTAPDGRALLEIADTGVGMTEAVRRRVFEPFFTTKSPGRGTGLGLFVSLGIVRSAGGEIVVESTPGQGTLVRVLLPAAAAHPTSVEPVSTALTGMRRLLLVEDEAILRAAYARTLRQRFEVVLAEGANEALQLLDKDHRFDAVVCDVHLADGSGEALLCSVQDRWPALADRMLFMTGGAMTAQSASFIEKMGSRVLQKPLELDELTARIEDVTRNVLNASIGG